MSEFHRTLAVECPAKVNLRFWVEGRRSDGFHLLSLFNLTVAATSSAAFSGKPACMLQDSLALNYQEIGDDVEVALTSSGSCAAQVVDDLEKNLIVRATRSYCAESGFSGTFRYTLEKEIPVGAGMGGGSADAAGALRLLQKFAGSQRLSDEKLLSLAATLGADVPYFLTSGFARVAGIGEKVEPLYDGFLSDALFFVVLSPDGCPTPEVYRRFRADQPVIDKRADLEGAKLLESLRLAKTTIQELGEMGTSALAKRSHRKALYNLLHNDLTPSAIALFPALGAIAQTLSALPQCKVVMSGSGSSFIVVPENFQAPSAELIAALAATGLQIIAVKPQLKLSPLLERR